MKIDYLKINNFGKLKNKEIKLQPNINIIYGENESGKSTLLKFILGMFYGLSKNKNGKWISDMERYTPWEGEDFSGKIEYHLENKEKFEVFREFKKKSPKIYDSNSVDITKKFTIDKTRGNLFFVDQTAMEEELFCSTIVSEQANVKLEEKSRQSVIQRVANLMGTGQDNTSYEKVISKLNKRQLEEIGSEKSQERPINKTIKRIEELKEEIDALERYNNTQYEIQERKENLIKQIEQKENKLNALKEIKKMQDEQNIEEEKMKLKQEDLAEYNEKIDQIEKRKQEISNKKITFSKPSYLQSIIFVVVAIILFGIGFLVKNFIIYGLSILTLAFGIGSYIFIKQKYTKKINEANQENEKDIEILNEQIKMIKENEEEKKEIISAIKGKIDNNIEQEKSRIKNKYIRKVENIEEILERENITYEVEYLQNNINSKKLELQTLQLEEKQILPKLEKLSSMQEELQANLEKHQYLQEYAECIRLAKQTIEEAYSSMKKEVTPKFTQSLSKNMEHISKGKYKNVTLNDENEIMVETSNGSYVSAENLSVGTIDQIYLALRIAIAEDLGKELMPIILDEAFAYFDEERLSNVLEFLNNNFKDRQIIIFTCTKREQNILDKKQINYNKIEI